ncbi:hypothetical protein K439DRAFT_1645631 [Ramaria rubella]|nr:hypothetical protein K439DRAFT_1645631 [Ramaria rubella]
MACVSLGTEICYKAENMYIVGLITSPREPSLAELNHYMRPLMDDMVVTWERGIHFSRTSLYPTGCFTRSAIAASVNNLPAAQKASGLASHGSHFNCTVCQCWHQSTLGKTDFWVWTLRDKHKLREYATQWRDTTTSSEQEKIFHLHGVRWSELWRLSYWNPTCQLVVDSMHCILEGLVRYHSMDVLELTTALSLAKAKDIPSFDHHFQVPNPNQPDMNMPDKEIKQTKCIHALLVEPIDVENSDILEECLEILKTKLLKLNTEPLKFRTLKCDHAKALVAWQKLQPLGLGKPPPLKICTPELLCHIRAVVKNTVTPLWINSVPYNFRDPAAGTLKADEWRTRAMIYLPIALVTFWGTNSSHPTPAIASEFQNILDHTMSLFSATRLSYHDYIATYVRDLKEIHPHILEHRTIHHMALHIYDFLALFGPVRSWWCFPFECLIGMLQQLPHNHKFSQFEPMMLQSFIRGGNLRRWLGSLDYDQLLTGASQILPDNLRLLMKQWKGTLYACFKHDNVVYSRASTHLGNSLILFYAAGKTTSPPILGCVQYIVLLEGRITLCGIVDPLAPYPHFPAKLYSSQLVEHLEIVQVQWVLGHFARWSISSENVVILNLTRD